MPTFLVTETGEHLVTEAGAHLIVARAPAPQPPQSFGGMYLGSGRRPRRRTRPLFMAVEIVGQSDLEAELTVAPAAPSSASAQVFCPYVGRMVDPDVAQHNADFMILAL
ncbi:hypothetical protein [Reyranella sp.]|uniref:hypothetical protein n=1 Tax=Reyranella sp. TaxID=1929291 RepID=UPI0037849D2B